jgi:multiple sugar transport system permease protein
VRRPLAARLHLFTGGPLVFSIVISFCRFDVLNPAVFTGLYNYTFMLNGDELFWKSLWNTLFMVVGIPLGSGSASASPCC